MPPLHAIAVLTPHSLDFADETFDFFVEAEFESIGFNLEETEGSARFGPGPLFDWKRT